MRSKQATTKGDIPIFKRVTESIPKSVAKWFADTVIANEVEKRISGFANQPPILIRDSAFGVLLGVTRDDNVADAALDRVFLAPAKKTSLSLAASPLSRSQRLPDAALVQLERALDLRITQPSQGDDLHDFNAFDMQLHDLLAPLVQRSSV